MRARFFALATLAPVVLAIVWTLMATVALGEACPSSSAGGC